MENCCFFCNQVDQGLVVESFILASSRKINSIQFPLKNTNYKLVYLFIKLI